MAFFDKLSETLTNASKDVGQKAKDLSGVAKLTMDIHTKEDQVQNGGNKLNDGSNNG